MPLVSAKWVGIGPDRHRLSVLVDGRPTFEAELESRSTLRHDFVHYAVEVAAETAHGFFGRAARGLSEAVAPPELKAIEKAVGALQSALKGSFDPEHFVHRLADYMRSIGEEPPAWLTPCVVTRAEQIFRQVEGQWRKTPFGESMELNFPPGMVTKASDAGQELT